MILLDKLRTRLRDVIFGRTIIKVVSVGDAEEVTPVFIIGTFRSGTTLFRYLLDTHSRICCPPETKFLAHLASIHNVKDTRESLESMGLEEGYVRNNIRKLASSFFLPYLAAKKKDILIDKTPEYVRVLEFIDWLYEGRCKYLLIFRNGLDVAQSMNDQAIGPLEGNKTIDTAFEYWMHDTNIMLDWMDRRPDACHKVVYDSLCDDVEGVMTGVLNFIGLKWEPEILEWYAKQHDRGYEDIKARRQRKIKKSKGNYDQWKPETVSRLKRSAAEIHKRIGFDIETLDYKKTT